MIHRYRFTLGFAAALIALAPLGARLVDLAVR